LIIGIRPMQRPNCRRHRLGMCEWEYFHSFGRSTAGLTAQPS
jgi:hypothetical protein